MCPAPAYWGRDRADLFYRATIGDALEYGGFDDTMIFAELRQPTGERTLPAQRIMRAEAVAIGQQYQKKPDKMPY